MGSLLAPVPDAPSAAVPASCLNDRCCQAVYFPPGLHPSSAVLTQIGESTDTVVPGFPPLQVFATAIATWQMGVWNAPSNRGLRASKFFFYDRYHYYQIPKRPIGTVRADCI